MLIDTFSEWFVSLGFEKFKDKLKNRSDEKQLKQRLHEYLTRYKQQFESIDRESEFDLQGVFDCFNKRVNSEITVFLFGKTYDERNAAREAIISKAEYSSNARNCEAKAQVTIFVNNILDIYRNFYEEPTRTLYEQSKSAINRRFCYNMEKDSVKLIVKAHE